MSGQRMRAADALATRIENTIGRDVSPMWEKVACLEWITAVPTAERTNAPVNARCAAEVDTSRASAADAARKVATTARAYLTRTADTAENFDDRARHMRARDLATAVASGAAEQRSLQRAAEHEAIVKARHVPAVGNPRPWNVDRNGSDLPTENDAIRDARARMARGDRSGTRDLATVAESCATWRAPDAFKVAADREQAALDAADDRARFGTTAEQRPTARRSTRGAGAAERRKARRAAVRQGAAE